MQEDTVGQGCRVLVVDDDPDVRRITATFLRRPWRRQKNSRFSSPEMRL